MAIDPRHPAATRWAILRRPALWVELAVALAWVALLVGNATAQGQGPAGGSSWDGGPLWLCMPGMTGGGAGGGLGARVAPASLLAGLPAWGLMAVAMMVPTALPAVRHVTVHSLHWRRRRAVVEFLIPFLAIWVAFGAVALGGLGALGLAGSPAALAAALAIAALWQLTPLKRRAQLACHRSRPLPPRGPRASAGVVRFGLQNGGACLASCWAMMLTMAFAGPLRLAWMAGLTGLMTAEKLNPAPRRSARRVAALLTATAAAVALPTFGVP